MRPKQVVVYGVSGVVCLYSSFVSVGQMVPDVLGISGIVLLFVMTLEATGVFTVAADARKGEGG